MTSWAQTLQYYYKLCAPIGTFLTPQMFGAAGDGITNDTTAIQSFLTALRGGGFGSWGEAVYLVDEGVLVLQSTGSPVHTPPTAGVKSFQAPTIIGTAVFVGRGTGSGPFLSVKGPDDGSGVYAGGSLGNLYFIDNSNSQITTRHGLYIRGIQAWVVNSVTSYALAGSTVFISRDTISGNPDPFDCSGNFFNFILNNGGNGPAWDAATLADDNNYIGTVGSLGLPASGLNNPNGAFVTCGQGTVANTIFTGPSLGWGVYMPSSPYHGDRIKMLDLELGGSQNGVWLDSSEQFEVTGRIEFSDAHNQDPAIPANTIIWPQTAFKLGPGSPGNTNQGKIELIFRIDSGTLAMLGTAPFLDLSNEAIGFTEFDIKIIDNAGMGILSNGLLGIPVTGGSHPFVANLNTSAQVLVRVNNATVLRQNCDLAIKVRLAGSTSDTVIPGSGYGTTTCKLGSLGGTFSNLDLPDSFGLLDAANHQLNVLGTARYDITCVLTLPIGVASGTIAAGSLVRYALIDDDGNGNLELLYEGNELTVNAGGIHVIKMDVKAQWIQDGHKVWIGLQAAGQNGTCYLSAAAASGFLDSLHVANMLEMKLSLV